MSRRQVPVELIVEFAELWNCGWHKLLKLAETSKQTNIEITQRQVTIQIATNKKNNLNVLKGK